MKIADVEARSTSDDPGAPRNQIKAVAFDSSTVTAGTHGTTVAHSVPIPEGVPHDNTVQDER